MEKGKSGEGGQGGGGDGGVSIQLPRISSARGDSPPRICHLRGARLPTDLRSTVSRNITTIYTRATGRVADSEASIRAG